VRFPEKIDNELVKAMPDDVVGPFEIARQLDPKNPVLLVQLALLHHQPHEKPDVTLPD
jgi:hypothetical protein